MGETPGASGPSTSKTEGIALVPGRPFVGPYRLCVELASGGMATVFLAQAPGRAGRHSYVALKRIHPHLAKDRTFVDMFLDEARIASLIQHTHVCSVFDFGADGGQQYLVMEYLIGEPLSNLGRALRRSPPVPAQSHALAMARIIADAAEGLHAAHELRDSHGEPLGVVHRDVSPDNIFLTYDGVVKIVDFGVASATRQLHKTRTGIIKGKYAYLQPEVLRGEKPDRRADVWSLAVVLWELLTLKRLFHRETDFLTLRAIADAEVRAPSKVRPGVPPELDRIVLRALSRNPAERFPSARALADELMGYVAQRREVMGFAQLAALMDRALGAEHSKRMGFMDWVSAHCPPSVDPEPDRRATPALYLPHSERPSTAGSAPEWSETSLTVAAPTPRRMHGSQSVRPPPLPSFPLTPTGHSSPPFGPLGSPALPVSYSVPPSSGRSSLHSILRRWRSRTPTVAASLTSAGLAAAAMALLLPRGSLQSEGTAGGPAETRKGTVAASIPAPTSPAVTDANRVPAADVERGKVEKAGDEAPSGVPIELADGDYVVELGSRDAEPSRGLVLRIVPKKKPRPRPPDPPKVDPEPTTSQTPEPTPRTPEQKPRASPYVFMPTVP